ncbi:hypothetical protein [Nocardioides mangrovi]|uniref:Restriction endonuclease n=1 Tax=Nocardioides mangrovi TaxID=2874580 RepID=A0ABS7UG35_9ACTN|nr:hypothetical protein [Nocardioides mangrovi]MBZ5739760.1 hypothetical protein [Nocardioides mangrovi]
MPRFIELVQTDAAGTRDPADLPVELPYHLAPRDILRCVEDLHQLLHDLNTQLDDKGYERLEELLDPAGFSGLMSRAVVDNIHRQSRALDRNEYHNGYPDLVPHGVYPQNKAQHGDRGGLEVKASRYDGSWQSHGPRAGWFCVVQFEIDDDEDKALKDREPTRIRAVMIAELTKDDWSWQPAKEDRIRSGTASVKVTGRYKLRAGAVWVDPDYEDEHQRLLSRAKLESWAESRDEAVLAYFTTHPDDEVKKQDVIDWLAAEHGLESDDIKGRVGTGITNLVKTGQVERVKPGVFQLTP